MSEFDISKFILLGMGIVTLNPKPFIYMVSGLFLTSIGMWLLFNFWIMLLYIFIYLTVMVIYIRKKYFHEIEAMCWVNDLMEELE